MLKMRVVGLLGLLAISGMARADLNDGLVAYYSFDDCTARDVSGNGMDGSIKNNVSCTQGIQGSKAIGLTHGFEALAECHQLVNNHTKLNGIDGFSSSSFK